MNIVDVKGLSVFFSRKTVVRDISFSLDENGLYALIGANGAGKSTILKCIAGIVPANGIFILGRSLKSLKRKELAREVAFLPQILVSSPFEVKGFLNFSFYSRGLSGKACEGEIEEVASVLGIEHLLNSTLDAISGGELELVYIAACVLQKPKVLLADEPTTFLDPYYRKRVQEVLLELSNRMVVIVATHELEWVRSSFRRVLGLKGSKLVMDAEAKSVPLCEMMKLFERAG